MERNIGNEGGNSEECRIPYLDNKIGGEGFRGKRFDESL